MRMTVRKIILTALALALMCLTDAAAQHVKIWAGYGYDGGRRRSELTAYIPSPENNSGIAVVVCPGGSYCYLGMDHEGRQVARWLNSLGIAAFVLRYRVGMYGNRHPAMIEDLQRSMQIVREGAAEWGIDPAKVGAMGFSAGGHLVGTLGTYFDRDWLAEAGVGHEVSLCPAFVAMIYPVVTMRDDLAHRKSRRNLLSRQRTPELEGMMSLEEHVRRDMPPVFLMCCRDDRTVDCRNSIRYAEALEQAGAKYEFVIFEKGDHGFGVDPRRDRGGVVEEWTARFAGWLKKTVAEE